jgi:hypothetical protein
MPEIVGSLRTPRLTGPPSSPIPGEMYFDSGTNILYWWDGSQWIPAKGNGGGSSGADLVYNGQYPTGGPDFTDGDIVVKDGIAYICVRPTSSPPVPWTAGPAPLVTALPTPLYDGQEILFADSLTAPTYMWRLKWIAATAKWWFLGGNDLLTQYTGATITATTNATWQDPATNTMSLTVPVTGTYRITMGLKATVSGATSGTVQRSHGIMVNGVVASPTLQTIIRTQFDVDPFVEREWETSFNAGDVLKIILLGGASPIVYGMAYLRFNLRPVKLG